MKQPPPAAAAAAAGPANVWPPRVLNTIYKDRVQTLYELLLHLLCRSSYNGLHTCEDGAVQLERTRNEAAAKNAEKEESFFQLEKEAAQNLLIRRCDPLSYTKLLNKSYAVMPNTVPALGPLTLEQRWTQEQIVERVIELQFRQDARPSHVLCSGYRKLRPSLIGSSGKRAPMGLECASGNAAVDMLNSDSWRLLLSRVGDMVMLHILSHVAIFTPLPNDCLLQVSGVPVYSAVSVFRKSSKLHTGEKLLRRHAKRKLMSDSTSSLSQPESWPAKKRERQGCCQGPSSSKHVVKDAKTAQQACELNLKPVDNLVRPNSVERKAGNSHILQTSGAVISRRHRAKRKAQESTFSSDNELLSGSEDPSLDRRKRRKLECDVLLGKAVQRCRDGTETDATAKECFLRGKKDQSDDLQTSNRQQLMKDKEKLRRKNVKRRTKELIPITTPGSASGKTVSSMKCGGSDSMQKTGRTPGAYKSSTDSENGSNREETSLNLPESSRTKRVRPPSWKRRKMRQQGLDALHKETILQQLEGGSGISKMGTVKISEVDPIRDDSSHVVRSAPFEDREASETEAVATNAEARDMVQEKTATPTVHTKVSPSINQGRDYASPWGRPSLMFINRASIFYNSSFSRYPGLPANHIINRMKADDGGVEHLDAAIFGPLKKISTCSSTDPSSFVDITPTRSVQTLLKKLLSNAKSCAYARLLSRHCPLPQELNSQLVESSTPFLTAAGTPFPESQDGQNSSQAISEKLETENRDVQSPEVEEVMKLLLGPLYRPNEISNAKLCASFEDCTEENTSGITWIEGNKGDPCKEKFRDSKQEKDFVDATHAANVVNTEKALRAGLIASYTDHHSVVSFLWAVCRSIVPAEMLGSKRSWRILRSNIAHFVSLRRHEKFNVQHVLFKLKLSTQPWLSSESSSNSGKGRNVLQQRKLELWLYWLFSNLVVPLIRCHFYVTEIENHRQNVFYYRKPVWAKLRNIALKDLTQRNYKKLSKKSVAEALDAKILGFSQVRLLPKRTGVRPIANLAAPSQCTLKLKVKTEKRHTLRQLFGDFGKASVSYVAKSLTRSRQNISEKAVVDPSKSFIQEISGQKSHLISSRIVHQNSTRTSNRSSFDSFADFSPNKAFESPAKSQNSLTSPRSWCQNSPLGRLSLIKSPGSSSSRTPPSVDMLQAGGRRSYTRVSRKSVKRVNYSFRSVNSVLRDVYFCLKLEKDSYPDDFGSSVFGYSDIHAKVLPFILQMKSTGAVPRLYMVVCDVTKAYDSIQQEKLLEIVSGYLRSYDYNVLKYTSVTPALASVRVSHGRTPTRACERRNFSHLVPYLAAKQPQSIFIDQGSCSSIRKEKILVLLEELLKRNIIQMGKQFYQQTVGIPQGSTISSILCSLFYGHFESHRLMPDLRSCLTDRLSSTSNLTRCRKSDLGLHLPQGENLAVVTREVDVEQILECSLDVWTQDPATASGVGDIALVAPHGSSLEDKKSDDCINEMAASVLKNSVLLRLIDDSLFISTSEALATIFVERMHTGSEEYGCQANRRKTAASFPVQLGRRTLPKKIYTTEDGACFMRWSGLLVNCYTVEFQADYTRYSGEHIRSTLTVKREENQGWHLVLKMCQHMRPKCHALFFDPRINSPATIRLNAFQAFLLCAMKLHAYVCCLPRVTGDNQPFLYEVIRSTTRYMYGLLRHRMETVGAEAAECFPYVELEWLGLVAFHKILKRKQSRYRLLLQGLHAQLESPRFRRMTSCPHLSSAVDERRSSMFKYIKY
ncbi:hypothetical protein R1flu_024524 [Riccia fluitans]|uniref:Telomerase reverse transcriptase n=1 Tax=Riccia fluitans TaxID=41844 RepID=A0ABD1XV42_9MARC